MIEPFCRLQKFLISGNTININKNFIHPPLFHTQGTLKKIPIAIQGYMRNKIRQRHQYILGLPTTCIDICIPQSRQNLMDTIP